MGVEESEPFDILNYVAEKTGEVFDTVDSRSMNDENPALNIALAP